MDPDVEAQRRVGTTLRNKWTLERLIGTGGMAAVYVAVHKIGRREAIKILHPDVAKDPDLRARFEQEAHAVNRFKHPGAVEVRDIDVSDDGAPFLVMELLEGETLSELARKPGGVALPDLLRLVDELLDVLAAAHAQGIVHRDIKPDNLFVLRDGRLKVLDFGIARVRRDTQSKKPKTRMGATLGTAPYMPPEQIKGQEIDARADLFAVGATMFRLIAKRRIHEAPNETETLVKMASEPAPPLASVTEAPRDVCLVVDRALMFERVNRYPDAATMQEDVRALREGRAPPYAHAKLLDGTPAPSALRAPVLSVAEPGGQAIVIVPSVSPTRSPVSGEAATSYAPSQSNVVHDTPVTVGARLVVDAPITPRTAGPPSVERRLEITAAASPIAIESSASPASSAVPTLERTTQPMPPSQPGIASPASQASPTSLPQGATPAPNAVFRPPGADRTLKSALADGQGAVRPQGYTAPAMVPVPVAGSGPGPRTVPQGMEPLPPGASVPVVSPRRDEPNVVLLVLVGVAFAAIGVGLTLFFMLRGAHDKGSSTAPTAAATADSDPPETWPPAPRRPTAQPKPAQPKPPQAQPLPQHPLPIQIPRFEPPPPQPANPGGQSPPPPPPPQGGPGKGHGKGHKKD